jgi:hypothetical protein
MWAFCSIFANAFADKFPLGDMEDGYKLYIAMFMVVTVTGMHFYQGPADPNGMHDGTFVMVS